MSSLSSNVLRAFFGRLIEAHASIEDANLRRKAETSAAISLFIAVLTFIAAALVYLQRNNYILYLAIGLLSISFVSVISYFLSRSRVPAVAAVLLSVSLTVAGYTMTIASGQSVNTALYFTIPLSVLLGSILLPVWAAIALVIVNVILTPLVPLVVNSFPALNANLLALNFTIIGSSVLIVMVARNILERRRVAEVVDANQKLQSLQEQLERRVEERTHQVRIAADIAQNITSSLDLNELLQRTVNLIIDRFGYYHAAIFLVDETERYVVLRAAQGPMAEKIMANPYRLAVGSASIIGWVTANKQPRMASNVADDPIHLKNEFLPETQSEAAVPIMSGTQVLGALDIQSVNVNAFDNETILTLRTLANQLATAIQNVHSVEMGQFGVQNIRELYRTISTIVDAQSEQEIQQKIRDLFARSPYFSFYLAPQPGGFQIAIRSGLKSSDEVYIPSALAVTSSDVDLLVSKGVFIGDDAQIYTLPGSFVKLLGYLHASSVALIPVLQGTNLLGIYLIGTRETKPLSASNIEPFLYAAELTSASLIRINSIKQREHHIAELESLAAASQELNSLHDLPTLYKTLHQWVNQAMGDVDFLVALYDRETDSISIPYMTEEEAGIQQVTSVETFPLGEGLTSILIKNKQPLMIVEDTEKRAAALGAKVVGKAAKSWLGVPVMVAEDVIGALIVQDTVHEHAFADRDMQYLSTLGSQVSGIIHNVQLLEETETRTVQLQTAAEIARDISGSLDLNELLKEAVNLVRDRFNFYHASVFLVDSANEYAVIREATGDAGNQMKRAGHKLKIGSKSIVGFTTSSGEPLIVNDTSHDATYYANPLLPNTRAEAALPLKVGTRIVGALDVQSSKPYAFDRDAISVMQILADQLAVAVINSELFAETQEHLSQHRLLHHVTTAAASGTTMDEALSSAVQGLQVTLGGDRVAILLADKEKGLLTVKAIAGYSEDVKQVTVPFGEGITGWVAAHVQPQRINDISQDPRYIEVGSNVRSELAVPLSYRGELLGVLNVESDQVGAYTENDEELLGTLGGSLAAIMSNARLLEKIRHQVDNERLLYELTSKIRRSADMQTIMATTTNELGKALGARRAQIKINMGNDQDREKPN